MSKLFEQDQIIWVGIKRFENWICWDIDIDMNKKLILDFISMHPIYIMYDP